MQNKIIEIVALVFEISADELNQDSNLNSVQAWDSMNHMKLVLALEEEFNCKISDDDAIDLLSIKLIKQYFE